jgi:hypothetical protein
MGQFPPHVWVMAKVGLDTRNFPDITFFSVFPRWFKAFNGNFLVSRRAENRRLYYNRTSFILRGITMVDHILLKQLNHTDPERRKKAVMELARTKDREALSYLATVYRSDSDPEVRELARKAGIFINKHTDGQKSKNDTPIYGPSDDDDDDSYYGTESDSYLDDEIVPEKDINVSPLDAERANGLVKQAMDAHMRGNNDRALKYLRQALDKNPSLKKDSYTLSLASTITGMTGDQAIRYVVGDDRKQKAKRGAGQHDPEDPTWGDAIVDLLIYGLVNAGLVIVGFFLVLGVFNTALANNPAAMTAITGSSMPTGVNTATVVSQVSAIGGIIALIYSAIYGVGSMIGLFLFTYLPIHFVSVSFLGGEGTLTRLITKATIPFTVVTVIALVGFVGVTYLSIVSPDSIGVATILNLVLIFGPTFLVAQRIGVAYRFGMGNGCAAIFLSTILLFAVFCVCQIALASSLSSGFN